MQDIGLAKEVYSFYKTRPGRRSGSILIQNKKEFAASVKFELQAKLDSIFKEIKKKGDSYIAPSAWHAALFLEDQLLKEARISGPLVFRGHGNKRWNFVPTLNRKGTDVEESKQRTELLGDMICRVFFLEGVVPRIHKPIAQHYGIPTSLLDFTFDPSVAIYFAATSKQRGNAVVYYIPLASAINKQCKIIIPPPMVERLYKQAGFFFEPNGDNLKELQSACLKIEFPKEKSFMCYRDGKLLDFWRDSSWFQSGGFSYFKNYKLVKTYDDNSIITAMARFCDRHFKKIKERSIAQWPASAVTEYYSIMEIPGLVYAQDREKLFLHWAKEFHQYLLWSTTQFPDDEEYSQTRQQIVDFIRASNPTITNLYYEIRTVPGMVRRPLRGQGK